MRVIIIRVHPQRFDGLKFAGTGMKELRWIGFIGAGKDTAKCWLDELEIVSVP